MRRTRTWKKRPSRVVAKAEAYELERSNVFAQAMKRNGTEPDEIDRLSKALSDRRRQPSKGTW